MPAETCLGPTAKYAHCFLCRSGRVCLFVSFVEVVSHYGFQKTEGSEASLWGGPFYLRQVRLHIYHNVTEDKHEDGKKARTVDPPRATLVSDTPICNPAVCVEWWMCTALKEGFRKDFEPAGKGCTPPPPLPEGFWRLSQEPGSPSRG